MPEKNHITKSGLASRRGALDIVHGVLSEARSLSDLTEGQAGILKPLKDADRARAQNLAVNILKHLGPIDTMLSAYVHKRPSLRAQNILRLCAVELLIDGISPYAVINSAVQIAKGSQKTAHVAGMINAVGRKIDQEGRAHWPDAPVQNLPNPLQRLLVGDYDADTVSRIEQAHMPIAPIDITLKNETYLSNFQSLLNAEHLGGATLRLPHGTQISTLPGFVEGMWWVQDFAASLPVRCFGDVAGQSILDLCAAPGGKTLQLAAAGAEVTAVDISSHRLKRLKTNLMRTGLKANVMCADAFAWTPGQKFDAILLDAPCSAVGTIRRHPDLPFLKTLETIESLSCLQHNILIRAFHWLRPGGRLIYSTCSMLRQEGEDQIKTFLQNTPDATLDPIDPGDLTLPKEWMLDNGCLQTLPFYWLDKGGMDGFFIARLRKNHNL